MAAKIVEDALDLVASYLAQNLCQKDYVSCCEDLRILAGREQHCFRPTTFTDVCSYDSIQGLMSMLNEKEKIRKSKGVYYTPADVVKFILSSALKGAEGTLNSENLKTSELDDVNYEDVCFKKTVFDPTCGAGEFLLNCPELKFDLLDAHETVSNNELVCRQPERTSQSKAYRL